MTAQWSEASKVSEKQGLLSQMLGDLRVTSRLRLTERGR